MAVQSKEMFDGVDAETAFRMFSPTDKTYQITWDCGSAEAARRQRIGGVGNVTEGGYTRQTSSDFFAEMAEADPDATVEVQE